MHTRTQGKGAVTPQETEPDRPASAGGSLAEVVLRGSGGGCGSHRDKEQQFLEVLNGVSPKEAIISPTSL